MFQDQSVKWHAFPALLFFLVVLAQPAGCQITYAPRTAYPTCESAWSLDAGDFNNDGFPDIAVTGWTNGEVSVHLNDQAGAFGAGTTFPTDPYASGIAAADLDNDGWDDIATAHQDWNTVAVLINNRDGTFGTAATYPVGSRTSNVEAGDLDGDGWFDLVVTNILSNDISVLINNQDGTFAPAVFYAAETTPMGSAIADLNGDGSPDIAVANYSWMKICVLFNNGDGTFQPRQQWSVGEGTRGIVAVDLDRDGDMDLATADYYSDEYTLLMNDGAGQFPVRNTEWLGTSGFQIETGDPDQDGDPDLFFADYNNSGMALLKNHGDATFADMVTFDTPMTGWGASGLVVADFDNDGRVDFAVSHLSGDSFSVGLNTTAPPPVFTQDPLIRTQPATLTVTGAGPGERVYFAYSMTGAAPAGFKPWMLGGMCLDLLAPVSLIGSSTANGSGEASLTIFIPAGAPPVPVWTQAVILRGIGNEDSVKSNYVEDQIQ